MESEKGGEDVGGKKQFLRAAVVHGYTNKQTYLVSRIL